jgi:hypothetical protein
MLKKNNQTKREGGSGQDGAHLAPNGPIGFQICAILSRHSLSYFSFSLFYFNLSFFILFPFVFWYSSRVVAFPSLIAHPEPFATAGIIIYHVSKGCFVCIAGGWVFLANSCPSYEAFVLPCTLRHWAGVWYSRYKLIAPHMLMVYLIDEVSGVHYQPAIHEDTDLLSRAILEKAPQIHFFPLLPILSLYTERNVSQTCWPTHEMQASA